MATFNLSKSHEVIPAKAGIQLYSVHGEPVEPFIPFNEPFDKLRVNGIISAGNSTPSFLTRFPFSRQ